MMRLYGTLPYKIVLLHGGPGDTGSLKVLAEELAPAGGVIEHLQTKATIAELLAELHADLTEVTSQPLILLGHSWGAWLALLYGAKHPEMVKQLLLVGCAPLTTSSVPLITAQRFSRLSLPEQEQFSALLQKLDRGEFTATDHPLLHQLLVKTDSYAVEASDKVSLSFDPVAHRQIWQEAEELRAKGVLTACLQQVTFPLTVIHGDCDPHPLTGVTEPLQQMQIAFRLCRLTNCGHYPYLEKFAKAEFYKMLRELLSS